MIKPNIRLRTVAALLVLAVTVGLFLTARAESPERCKPSGEIRLCFTDGQTGRAPDAGNETGGESPLDKAAKTVAVRLRSADAAPEEITACVTAEHNPRARAESRDSRGEDGADPG